MPQMGVSLEETRTDSLARRAGGTVPRHAARHAARSYERDVASSELVGAGLDEVRFGDRVAVRQAVEVLVLGDVEQDGARNDRRVAAADGPRATAEVALDGRSAPEVAVVAEV